MLTTGELAKRIGAVVLPILRKYRAHLPTLRLSAKSDNTLLTEADLEVQTAIIHCLRQLTPDMPIVAEEDSGSQPSPTSGSCWIVDPIDGTREFVDPKSREFCVVLALVQKFEPVMALLIAPELGRQGVPMVVTADLLRREICLDGQRIRPRVPSTALRSISATRDLPERRPFEAVYSGSGVALKLRTTSQSLDLLRVATDLRRHSDLDLGPFDLFVREQQHLWDGAAGLVLARIVGHVATDWSGRPMIPIDQQALRNKCFPTVAVGPETFVADFVRVVATTSAASGRP